MSDRTEDHATARRLRLTYEAGRSVECTVSDFVAAHAHDLTDDDIDALAALAAGASFTIDDREPRVKVERLA